MLEFSADTQIRRVGRLVDELFQNVLYDEEPLFVSDEATLWTVSMSDDADVLNRCSKYYRVEVSMEDTQQPLWELLLLLDDRRRALNSPPS